MRGQDFRGGRFLIQTSAERRPRRHHLFRRRHLQPQSIRRAGGLAITCGEGGRTLDAGELSTPESRKSDLVAARYGTRSLRRTYELPEQTEV